jgi:hypothetical protein
LDAAARVIRPGVTTDEIDRVVHDATIAAGMSFYSPEYISTCSFYNPSFFVLFELFTRTLLLSTKDMTGWSKYYYMLMRKQANYFTLMLLHPFLKLLEWIQILLAVKI